MPTHFYFIRHGETDWNKLGKIQGHTDIPLNKTGVYQAKQIARRMSNSPIDVICSSDLSRAVKTAEEIKKYHPNAPHLIFPEFRERHFANWEGMTLKEITARGGNQDHQKVQLNGIETLEEMQRRGLARLKQLFTKYEGKHIAIVSHGGFINALLHSFSKGQHGTGKTKLGNTAYNHISYHLGKWVIHTINDITHLD